MNLPNYVDYQYPKAAQFIDIHDTLEQHPGELTGGDYCLVVEGIVNATLQEHGIAEEAPRWADRR